IPHVIEKATAHFHSLKDDAPRHHAFVGVGWAKLPGGTDLEPIWLCISNAWDAATEEWRQNPLDRFTFSHRSLRPRDRWRLFPPMGVRLSLEEVENVRDCVRPALKREGPPTAAARLLGSALHSVARSKPRVGDNPIGDNPTCAA